MAKYGDRCICPVCPNHNTCAMSKHEWFYCMTGKSFQCIDFERSCICETCPVAKDLDLHHSFYCTRGAEAQPYGTNIPCGALLSRDLSGNVTGDEPIRKNPSSHLPSSYILILSALVRNGFF